MSTMRWSPSPITNQTPDEDNDTHGTVRDLMSYRSHAGTFLESGVFTMICEGPCDPEYTPVQICRVQR